MWLETYKATAMKPNEINNAIWKWGQAKHKVQLIGSTPFNNFCLILEKDKTGYQRMYQLASMIIFSLKDLVDDVNVDDIV
ncbi:hypothetical protein N7471_001819 [Penicillium samsonianum]|uniref:uncharacterized protein n=1 Tax=Penicillium samsonianum TaxID=1882272 RepID=UPI002546DF3C|nr:uncharacterized protein N7471_001819 [Penicillium samsonianum]KAJ6150620.1 hypothetical protein N7471_001819 [Penicillium samsonianum]